VSEKHDAGGEHAKAEAPASEHGKADTHGKADAHAKPDAHGHDAHGPAKPGPQKAIGVTMAVLGVMLALCAAMVGSARTELIRNTVEQANQYSELQAETMKYRVMQSDYDLLHAVTPNAAEMQKFGKRLGEVRSKSGKADDEDTAEIKEAIDTSTRELTDLLTPDKEDEERLLKKKREYARDVAEAKEDAEAYDLIINAYGDAATGFERAQLCTEVGLVVASMALLLSNRLLWVISLIVGLAGGGVAAKTQKDKSDRIGAAEQKIKDAATHQAAIANEEAEGEESPAPPGSGTPQKKPETKPETKKE